MLKSVRALLVAAALVVASAAAPAAASAAAPAAASVADLRLYAVDCGRADFADLAPFADTGEYEGQPGTLMAACFLIRHPKGTLLWDAGLGDRYAEAVEGTQLPLFHARVPVTVAAQLAHLGLTFDDITHFAFSHAHGDHLGNANALKQAVWLVNRKELAWMTATPPPPRTNPALTTQLASAKTIPLDGDYDVFGDGSVKILSTPGHTPGHQVLLVKLKSSGYVLLSGDLFHTRANRNARRMPVFNASRAETLASIDRVEKIVTRLHARVVIQHDREDFEALPKLPLYLD
jgi:N-acyl homoserine lactone hydrolase